LLYNISSPPCLYSKPRADADVNGNISNATAIGSNAKVGASNTIQLGDGNVTSVNTSGAFNAYGYTCKPCATGTFMGNTFNIDWTGSLPNYGSYVTQEFYPGFIL